MHNEIRKYLIKNKTFKQKQNKYLIQKKKKKEIGEIKKFLQKILFAKKRKENRRYGKCWIKHAKLHYERGKFVLLNYFKIEIFN